MSFQWRTGADGVARALSTIEGEPSMMNGLAHPSVGLRCLGDCGGRLDFGQPAKDHDPKCSGCVGASELRLAPATSDDPVPDPPDADQGLEPPPSAPDGALT